MATVEIDVMEPKVCAGDVALLCTDGLTKMVEDPVIVKTLQTAGDPLSACRSLVTLALDRGGRDNVTVAVAEVKREQYFERLKAVWRERFNKKGRAQ